MNKAVILARVSTKKQEDEGLSLQEIQLPRLREYAKEKGFEVANEFVFQESADRKIRTKFLEMVEYVKTNKDIKAIIAFRVDRITRNYRDAVEMDNLRMDYDKELHFVDDRLILNAKTFGREILDWDMKVFLAKQVINRLKEDAHNTLLTKLRNQEVYGKAPYGYLNIDLGNNKRGVEKKPFEAGIVKKIFDLYSTGAYSMLQIRLMLQKDYNIKMGKSKIERILDNPFYYGRMRVEGEFYPHQYETIISKEVYDIVQNIRAGKSLNKNFKFVGIPNLYKGLIRCSDCGCIITPENKRKVQKNGNVHEYVYYQCTQSKGKHGASRLEEKEITKQIAEIYRSMHIPDEDLEKMTKELREAHEGKVEFYNEMFEEYISKIKTLQNRIEEAYLDKLDHRITQENYDNLCTRFRKEQEDYQDKLNRLQSADKEYYITVEYLINLCSRSYEIFTGSEPDQKREIIQLTLLNLRMNGKKIEYDLQKPFDSIFEMANSPVWEE